MTLQSMDVEHIFDLDIDFEQPAQMFNTPTGMKLIFVVRQGTVSGPKLNGEILPGGGDWVTFTADGLAYIDVRITIRAEDGGLILMTNAGRVAMTPEEQNRWLAGETIAAKSAYARTTPLFHTSADPHTWLNGCVTIGLPDMALDHIHYEIYRLR